MSNLFGLVRYPNLLLMEQASVNLCLSQQFQLQGSLFIMEKPCFIPKLIIPVTVFNEEHEKYKCNICNGILQEPQQGLCGHRFCKKCVNGLIENQGKVFCQPCKTIDGIDTLLTKEMNSDATVRREMYKLSARCWSDGCTWTGTFRKLTTEHLDECNFLMGLCSFCGKKLSRKNSKDHLLECGRSANLESAHKRNRVAHVDAKEKRSSEIEGNLTRRTLRSNAGTSHTSASSDSEKLCSNTSNTRIKNTHEVGKKLYPPLELLDGEEGCSAFDVTQSNTQSQDTSKKHKRSPNLNWKNCEGVGTDPKWNDICNNPFNYYVCNNPFNLCIGFVVVAFVSYVSYFAMNNGGSNHHPQDDLKDDPFKIFQTSMKNMSKSFTSQDKQLWIMMLSSTREIVTKSLPVRPAVVLYAADGNTYETALCLLKKLLRTVNSILTGSNGAAPIIKADEFMDNQKSKHFLDNFITDNHESRVIGILNIEKLHGDAALMLHNYCDNENAPYKDLQISLLVKVPPDIKEYEERDIVRFLVKLWTHHIGEDRAAALVNRITPNIVIPIQESHSVLSTHCNGF